MIFVVNLLAAGACCEEEQLATETRGVCEDDPSCSRCTGSNGPWRTTAATTTSIHQSWWMKHFLLYWGYSLDQQLGHACLNHGMPLIRVGSTSSSDVRLPRRRLVHFLRKILKVNATIFCMKCTRVHVTVPFNWSYWALISSQNDENRQMLLRCLQLQLSFQLPWLWPMALPLSPIDSHHMLALCSLAIDSAVQHVARSVLAYSVMSLCECMIALHLVQQVSAFTVCIMELSHALSHTIALCATFIIITSFSSLRLNIFNKSFPP